MHTTGYKVVSIRDRRGGAKCGGFLPLQREDFNCMVHIRHCENEERSLHFYDWILKHYWWQIGTDQVTRRTTVLQS
jgi:hypothetical protein